jgi:radical SAM superfamily enzyme YgiQ (UPF0313 family)
MRVLLISANREEVNMRAWPLGVALIATSVRRAGHSVRVLDLMESSDPWSSARDAIEEFRPDLIGVSVRNVDNQSMTDPQFYLEQVRDLVIHCRELTTAPIVLGGAGYSIYPGSLLEYLKADMGIQGGGERAFVTLIDRLEKGATLTDVPGLYLPGLGLQAELPLDKDLEGLALPDSQSLGSYSFSGEAFWLPVQTRRGCPMKCSYCSTGTIEGCILRKRSPESVVKWLTEWVKLGVKRYYFVDNTFNLPPSYAKKLCKELRAADLDISWRCIIYPTRVDSELAELMGQAGCKEVSVGFESGSEMILHGMNKKFEPDDVRRVCDLLAKQGIRRMGFLLLGGPGETRESALESLKFADSLRLDTLKVSVGIRIYPYTILAKTAREQGIIGEDDDLLAPRFYMIPELEDWLRETVQQWMSDRPNWIT